jgi:hypothetical protein
MRRTEKYAAMTKDAAQRSRWTFSEAVNSWYFLPNSPPFVKLKFGRKRERSFSEKDQMELQDNVDDDTGSKGKRKGEVIPLDVYISGKPTDPWDLILYHKDKPHKDENPPNDQQHLSYPTKIHSSYPLKSKMTRCNLTIGFYQ